MKLAVAIATSNRCSLVEETVRRLALQTRHPDKIVVCIPDTGARALHAPQAWINPDDTPPMPGAAEPLAVPLVLLVGRQGLSSQRNAILQYLQADGVDIVTFIDDDFLLARDYLAGVADEFAAHPDYVVTMGHVRYDGIHGPGFSLTEGAALLDRAEKEPAPAGRPPVIDHPGAYGCNMSIRLAAVGATRFDEKLPLYGWQEDIDFTHQLSRRGRVVELSRLKGVHLGYRVGRQSGVRFGYSQITNPVYLMRKGTMPLRFGLELMLRNLAANASRSVRPEPYVDRRGRLRGNLIALRHVATGRIEPEHILNL